MQAGASYLEQIRHIARSMRSAKRLLFITGAGISADSGLPTYRGIGGLYHGNQTEENISIESALSGQMLQKKPEFVWKYIYQIEKACRGAVFNQAHKIIAELEAHFEKVLVLTQNIDGLHKEAGSSDIIDIHGDIHHLSCTGFVCGYRKYVKDFSGMAELPLCPECCSFLRPQVVLFGERLSEEKLQKLWREMSTGFDMVFSIGTTSVFPYISQPVFAAVSQKKPTVEINPGETEVSHAVDFRLQTTSVRALEDIRNAFHEL